MTRVLSQRQQDHDLQLEQWIEGCAAREPHPAEPDTVDRHRAPAAAALIVAEVVIGVRHPVPDIHDLLTGR